MKQHDELVMWVDGQRDRWVSEFFPVRQQWSAEEQLLWHRCKAEAPLPEMPAPLVTVTWEKPVTQGQTNRYGAWEAKKIVGFVDLFLKCELPSLEAQWSAGPANEVQDCRLVWNRINSHQQILPLAFEAKPVIDDLGALLRQIQTYKLYLNARFVVVSPDCRYEKILTDQGVAFRSPGGTSLSLGL